MRIHYQKCSIILHFGRRVPASQGRFLWMATVPSLPNSVLGLQFCLMSVRGLYESDESVIRRPLLKS